MHLYCHPSCPPVASPSIDDDIEAKESAVDGVKSVPRKRKGAKKSTTMARWTRCPARWRVVKKEEERRLVNKGINIGTTC
jgi:hypothetical protein